MPKLVIIPTVDVEGVHGERPFEQLVLGNIGEKETWGVEKISRILQRHGATGTFFVDVYEHSLWGKEPWESICTHLAEWGQDVQLHTHPGWRDDPRDFDWLREHKKSHSFLSHEKDFMAKLSFTEQVEVLEHGAHLLKTWLGESPIAHRSGGYSVDGNTIRALAQTGFLVDSSQYRGHANSLLRWSMNAVRQQDGILEIPVTLYERGFVSIGPKVRGTFRTLMTSPHFSRVDELIGFCQHALESGLPVMNLFMHSYELLKMDKRFKKIEPHPPSVHRLEKILQWANQQPDVAVMSIKQYYESNLWHTYLSDNPADMIPRFTHGGQLVIDLFNKIRYTLA